jgi:hypothetical protein
MSDLWNIFLNAFCQCEFLCFEGGPNLLGSFLIFLVGAPTIFILVFTWMDNKNENKAYWVKKTIGVIAPVLLFYLFYLHLR